MHDSCKILTQLQVTDCGRNIAHITLNKPSALNALDLDMVNLMSGYLQKWRDDQSIVAIVIDGAGEKAFCAGGDIVSMYQAMVQKQKESPGQLPEFMAEFFTQEYTLDYVIHTYPKPIICWGNGIIMGGGLGVFAGASHKIVTQSSRVAMPEITIGLFPDVGASYFLTKMPLGVGMFMGLGAASVNATDCLNINLADHFILHENKKDFINKLLSLPHYSFDSVGDLCGQFANNTDSKHTQQKLTGNLDGLYEALQAFGAVNCVEEIEPLFTRLANQYAANKLAKKALSSFKHGSTITANLVLKQLQRARHMTLAQCFEMELCMAFKCATQGEFQEGVRALLIDKDMQPNWQYETVGSVPDVLIDAHFTLEHDVLNPLSSLVQEYGEKHA